MKDPTFKFDHRAIIYRNNKKAKRHWFIGCPSLAGCDDNAARKALMTSSIRRVTCGTCKMLILNAWYYYYKQLDWKKLTDAEAAEMLELAATRTDQMIPPSGDPNVPDPKKQFIEHDFSKRRL